MSVPPVLTGEITVKPMGQDLGSVLGLPSNRISSPDDIIKSLRAAQAATDMGSWAGGQIGSALDSPQPGIKPIPISQIDGKSKLKSLVTEAYRPTEGENAQDMATRLAALNEFSSKINDLPQMRPEEANAIFSEWYRNANPQPDPFSTFSPDAQAHLNAALGVGQTVPTTGEGISPQLKALMDKFDALGIPTASVSPQTVALLNQAYAPGTKPKTLSIGDIDPNEAAAAGAYLLVNRLFGGGTPNDFANVVNGLVGRGQARVDLANQAQMQTDNLNRQKALAQLSELQDLQHFNDSQLGYAAKDQRDMIRQLITQTEITDRAEGADKRRQLRDLVTAYAKQLPTLDPGRATAMKNFFEQVTGMKFDDALKELNPTLNQEQVKAQTGKTVADTALTNVRTQQEQLKLAADRKTFDSDVQARLNKNLITNEQLKKIKIEVAALPEGIQLQHAKLRVDQQTAITRANAALQRIQLAMQAAGAKPAKDRLSGLKANIAGLNTDADNVYKEEAHYLTRVESLKQEIQKWSGPAGDPVNQLPYLRKQLEEAEANYNSAHQKRMEAQNKLHAAADEIDRLTTGGKQ